MVMLLLTTNDDDDGCDVKIFDKKKKHDKSFLS